MILIGGQKMKWKIGTNAILLGIIVCLLMIIILKNQTPCVNAQGDGFARHVFGLIGQRQGNREPLYLIDTQEEVIMVYEYSVQGEGLGLVTTRSYKYDKKLEEFGRSFGYKLDKIKEILQKGEGY